MIELSKAQLEASGAPGAGNLNADVQYDAPYTFAVGTSWPDWNASTGTANTSSTPSTARRSAFYGVARGILFGFNPYWDTTLVIRLCGKTELVAGAARGIEPRICPMPAFLAVRGWSATARL
jgi:hypothetical protein